MVSDILRRAAQRLGPLAAVYTYRLKEYGPTARGVFWKSEDGQRLRFEVLMGVVAPEDEAAGGATVNDLGCGYGALFEFLADEPLMRNGRYYGYDICEAMVNTARRRLRDPRAAVTQSLIATEDADYSFASGTYNMKLDETDRDWAAYVEESLHQLWSKTRKGLAFNMLSIHRKTRRERDLYYADWHEYEDFCKSELSPHVTVVKDYPLAEWTILVRRQATRTPHT